MWMFWKQGSASLFCMKRRKLGKKEATQYENQKIGNQVDSWNYVSNYDCRTFTSERSCRHADIKREAVATYDYYVDANIGSDSNDGKSETNAFKTVKKAAETAGSGAKIKLGDGKYTLYKINSTGTTKGKDLTFIGNGADKTGWNIGAEVPDPANFGTEYNGDYSFDGAGTVTFKNMTLQSGNADYLGIIRADNTIVEDCTINGKTFYWGYERAEFKNTIFNCPKGDYALWTYSSPVMTFDHCTFNASGKVINVYTDASAGKHDITVNYKDCTVISTSKNKSVLNINDSNMGNYKYYVNISGNNTVSGLGTDTYTCSKLFAIWRIFGNIIVITRENL